jgi:hypothetical protein
MDNETISGIAQATGALIREQCEKLLKRIERIETHLGWEPEPDQSATKSVTTVTSYDDQGRIKTFEKVDVPAASKAAQAASLNYRGPWKASVTYQPGEFASFQGGLWHSEIQSKGLRPNDAPAAWKLAVKRGAADRMERDAQ